MRKYFSNAPTFIRGDYSSNPNYIEKTLLSAKDQTSLILIDNLGRKIEERKIGENYEGQELFDTRKFATGVYLYQIVQEGKKVSNGKFIVTH